MLNPFDSAIISWCRHFADGSWIIDYLTFCVSDNNLIKGSLFIATLWAFWFCITPDPDRNRSLVISTFFSGLVAVSLTQGIKMVAPMRLRPYEAGLTGFDFPFDLGMSRETSFPSDHASLFFALATGICFLSRRTAIAAYLYAIIIICLPRIILGLHYPSDLLSGAVIGIATACIINGTRIRDMVARPALSFSTKHPALFYTGAFLFSYQVATLFDDLRAMAHALQIVWDNLN